MVISYRRLRTTCRSHLLGSRIQKESCWSRLAKELRAETWAKCKLTSISLLAIAAFDRIGGVNRHLVLWLVVLLMVMILSLGWRPVLGHTKNWCLGSTWHYFGGVGFFGWINVWVLSSHWRSHKPKACDFGQTHMKLPCLRGWGLWAVPHLCIVPWRLPYNWGKIKENSQSGYLKGA